MELIKSWDTSPETKYTSIKWSPNSQYFSIIQKNKERQDTIVAFNTINTDSLPHVLRTKITKIIDICWIDNDEIILIDENGVIEILSVYFPSYRTRFLKLTTQITCVDCTPDGKYVIIGLKDGCAVTYDIHNDSLIRTWYGLETSEAKDLKISPDGKLFSICAANGVLRTYDIKTGSLKWCNKFDSTSAKLAQSYNSDMIAYAPFHGALRIVDADSGRLIVTNTEFSTANSVSWISRNRILFTPSFYLLRDWNVIFERPSVQVLLPEHDFGIDSFSVSPNMQFLVVAFSGSKVTIWKTHELELPQIQRESITPASSVEPRLGGTSISASFVEPGANVVYNAPVTATVIGHQTHFPTGDTVAPQVWPFGGNVTTIINSQPYTGSTFTQAPTGLSTQFQQIRQTTYQTQSSMTAGRNVIAPQVVVPPGGTYTLNINTGKSKH